MEICKRCGYQTNRKDYLKRHLSRKFECKPLLSNISVACLLNELNPENKFKCRYCEKTYTFISGRSRHEQTCTYTVKNLEQTPSANTVNNITNITNNTINNNYHIHLNAFGKETYEHIDFKRIFSDKNILFNLIKETHFNEQHPENWNVSINNERSKHANIYNGKDFVIIPKKEMIDMMLKNKSETLMDHTHLVEDEEKGEEYEKSYHDLISFINKENGCFNKVYDDAYEKLQVECYNNNRYFKQSKINLKQNSAVIDQNNEVF
jgi:hypothetical protein